MFQVRKVDKTLVLETINAWIKTHFKIQILWSNGNHFEAKTHRMDSKHRTLANQFSELATESLPKSPTPKVNYPPPPKPTPTQKNAWLDLSKVKKPPQSFGQPAATVDEDATVTTLTDSTWHSTTNVVAMTANHEKFKTIGRNVRQLSYRHKKVEVGQECLEAAVALKLNQLFRCFEFHHNRMERLEAARERHLAIQMQHLHYTLDPVEAEKDGTLFSLKKLLGKEAKLTEKDKLTLDNDVAKLEGEHEEDKEYTEKQTKAGWLFDYFHQKIKEDKDEELDFDVSNVSDVSDNNSETSEESQAKIIASKREPSPIPHIDDNCTIIDSIMQDVPNSNTLSLSGVKTLAQNQLYQHTQASPSWGSSDEEEQDPDLSVKASPIPQQKWTTTPSRQPRKSSPPKIPPNELPVKNHSTLRNKAQSLYRKAFPNENRFSVLTDEIITQPTDISMTSFGNDSSTELLQNISYQESEYEDTDSLDDASFDEMSLVSNSELQDLEDDLKHFEDEDDDGYDTETTNNTSPSTKPTSFMKRKASKIARTRITKLLNLAIPTHDYTREDVDQESLSPTTPPIHQPDKPRSKSVGLSSSSPLLSHNTISPREGQGAGKT